jgi:hypothetical protein
MKTGYFIIEHDNDSVSICFVEECKRTDMLFKELLNNIESERSIEIWEEFNEELENGLKVFTEWWYGDSEGWPFNGYKIIDAIPLFIY